MKKVAIYGRGGNGTFVVSRQTHVDELAHRLVEFGVVP